MFEDKPFNICILVLFKCNLLHCECIGLQPTFTVCQLVNGVYQQQQYRLGDTIYSDILPNLQLKLDDIMHI